MRKHLDFTQFKKKALKNPAIKFEYDKFQPEFAVIKVVLTARKEKGLTQRELAEKIGTKQSVISRLEIGRTNPTISFLQKIAKALNNRLEIRFTPT